jgi:urease accessory protein
MAASATSSPVCRLRSVSRIVVDVAHGRTRLLVGDLGGPLRVMRGFQLADGRLLIQIISASPGLFAGDRYELSLEIRSGARVVVLTPAATKIHSMPAGGAAEQWISAQVAPGGSLEIYPTLSIPFTQSEFSQNVDVELSGDARFGWLDPWAFGRISSGECYAFRRLETRISIERDGLPVYRDALRLDPSARPVSGWGMLEGATHAITGCWFGSCAPWTPAGLLSEPLISGTVGDDGLYVRGLFPDGASFRRALAAVHDRVSMAWGVEAISRSQFTL